MATDRLNEDKFDRMLSQMLKCHRDPTPAGFTAMVLGKIRQEQERKILACVVWQERLAMAACIALAGLAITVAAVFGEVAVSVFRGIGASLTGQGEGLVDLIPHALKAISVQWRQYSVLTAVFGFTVYSLLELLVGDRATIA